MIDRMRQPLIDAPPPEDTARPRKMSAASHPAAPAAMQQSVVATPLIRYALAGLRRCWMPDHGRYSYRYRFDAAERPNQMLAERDAYYSLNVLLGLSRLPVRLDCDYLDVDRTYRECCSILVVRHARPYMLAMALWSGAELGIEPPGMIVDRVRSLLADEAARLRASAQDVGMLLSGLTAMALRTGGWRPAAETLADQLRVHYHDQGSALFYDQGRGYRRRFASFASQVYSILALYQFGETFGRQWAVDLANRAAAKAIALQGAHGEWGWFYYVPQGRVVDFYEIYSVHQHGMAPAFLHHAIAHDVTGAGEGLVKGFLWLFGANEMGVSMLRPAECMFYRSQLRSGERNSARRRVARSLVNAALGRDDAVGRHHGLELRGECRSYELGWILWSFGGRNDRPELTDRPEFGID